ncbi:hypothetical protein FWK35_00021753 [Aphis craccivora]|uniref:Uncharacterized protein n=1 Tax=Aphis craccivora TaxID=307492 RepID=A0A6G0ZCY4_APHCR|nr:hypothetical protein FWK35_00021753 [Aphis craccivora]
MFVEIVLESMREPYRSLKTTFMYESSTETCSDRETKHRRLTESLGISRDGGAIVITSRSDLS